MSGGPIKLSYNAQSFRAKAEFTKADVLQLKEMPDDLVDRATTKLESVQAEGKIDYYRAYRPRFEKLWEKILADTDSTNDATPRSGSRSTSAHGKR